MKKKTEYQMKYEIKSNKSLKKSFKVGQAVWMDPEHKKGSDLI